MTTAVRLPDLSKRQMSNAPSDFFHKTTGEKATRKSFIFSFFVVQCITYTPYFVKDLIIDTLIIEEDRPAHIARHNITIDEVVEVLTSDNVYLSGRQERWLLIGKTAKKAFLTIVLGERPQENTYGLITARPARKNEVSIANMHGNKEVKNMKIKQAKKGTIQPIKPFQTIAEEAEYWDTHSILDDINEGTAAGFHQANKTDTLTIRFSHEDLQHLREQAFQQGVGPSTLARMLVKKGLQTL